MSYLLSNWLWILLIGGMLYMHFGPGMKGMHGGHSGGHGGGHGEKTTTPEPPPVSRVGRSATPPSADDAPPAHHH